MTGQKGKSGGKRPGAGRKYSVFAIRTGDIIYMQDKPMTAEVKKDRIIFTDGVTIMTFTRLPVNP